MIWVKKKFATEPCSPEAWNHFVRQGDHPSFPELRPEACTARAGRVLMAWVNWVSRPECDRSLVHHGYIIRGIIPKWPNNSGEWSIIIYPDSCYIMLSSPVGLVMYQFYQNMGLPIGFWHLWAIPWETRVTCLNCLSMRWCSLCRQYEHVWSNFANDMTMSCKITEHGEGW